MLLTVKQVAERLTVSASCIYQLVETGRLSHHRIGVGRGAIRFSEQDIDDFLSDARQHSQQTGTAADPPRRILKHLKL